MADLMDTIRHVLRLPPATPPPGMSDEQIRVAERQERIRDRQKAIDIQVEVLQADRAGLRRRRREG